MTPEIHFYSRFSTDDQEDGDSLTRQERTCKVFAARKGWTITHTLTDKGKSAYKNEHLSPGADLYDFTNRVSAGEIPTGSVLLVERLDRLSRRPVMEALVWLYGLTSRGLAVAIADKGQVLKGNLTLADLLSVALSWGSSNEESDKKSERITSAKLKLWGMAERKEGHWVNLSNRPPSWLSRRPTLDGWVKDEKRADIVRDIYQWSASGLGAVTICKKLNERGDRTWGVWRKYEDTWGRSAVRQLLANPAVEGDLVGLKGMFAGKVLHDFYPRIVDADVVVRARANQKARKKTKGESAATGTVSLFGGLAACGECGHRAHLTRHLSKGRPYAYYRCEGAAEGRCDNKAYYSYPAFETTVLDLCIDLALDDRFFEDSGDLRDARNRIAELEKAMADRRARRQGLMRSFDESDPDATTIANELKVEIDTLAAQMAVAKGNIERASGRASAVEHLRRTNDIREAASSDDPRIAEEARSKLRQAFGSIINSVSIERARDSGLKVFTVAFAAGILGVRIDTKGKVVGSVSRALGKPLWEHLDLERRAQVEPLIQRIEAQQTVVKLNQLTRNVR